MTTFLQFLFTGSYFLAFVLTLAIYASQATGNSETLGAARLIRVGAWLVASIWGVERMLEAPGAPIHSPMVIVAGMLAFSEIVSGLLRFKKILYQETIDLDDRRIRAFHPNTKLP
jgi:hypothetical protein